MIGGPMEHLYRKARRLRREAAFLAARIESVERAIEIAERQEVRHKNGVSARDEARDWNQLDDRKV